MEFTVTNLLNSLSIAPIEDTTNGVDDFIAITTTTPSISDIIDFGYLAEVTDFSNHALLSNDITLVITKDNELVYA